MYESEYNKRNNIGRVRRSFFCFEDSSATLKSSEFYLLQDFIGQEAAISLLYLWIGYGRHMSKIPCQRNIVNNRNHYMHYWFSKVLFLDLSTIRTMNIQYVCLFSICCLLNVFDFSSPYDFTQVLFLRKQVPRIAHLKVQEEHWRVRTEFAFQQKMLFS